MFKSLTAIAASVAQDVTTVGYNFPMNAIVTEGQKILPTNFSVKPINVSEINQHISSSKII